jgi:HK97 family phage major capsid protein
MGYTDIIGRADLTDAQLPEQVVTEVIQEAAQQSVILNRGRRVRMSAKLYKQPVLASLPEAYWVDGDTGLKQTSKADWENLTMTAEELAVIVPIPNAVVDDANMPLWDQIKPLLVEAIGLKIDSACLFGVDKPSSWPAAVVPAATAAGNVVQDTVGVDFWKTVSDLAGKIDEQGFAINGFATRPGLSWRLRGSRDENGRPIFDSQLTQAGQFGLFGYPLDEVRNGSWVAEAAELIAADWSKFIVGVRQDITYDLFTEGVISDASGKVVFNLMQQDSKALRVVTRVGFQVAVPLTRVGSGTRYPAGLITPAEPEPEPEP